MIFIELEKAYDGVSREVLWKILIRKGFHMVLHLIYVQDMHGMPTTSVRTPIDETKGFSSRR